MNQLVQLFNLAKELCSNGWLQSLAVVLIAVRVILEVDKAHSKLLASAPKWRKTILAIVDVGSMIGQRMNRMMGGDVKRKRPAAVEATLLAGDVALYWAYALWLFALGSFFIILLVLKRPHEIRLYVLSIVCTAVLYFFAAFYRNLGAKSFGSLTLLFRTRAGSVITLISMSAGIVGLASTLATVEYFAWPLFR
jgi:hypothetical protein